MSKNIWEADEDIRSLKSLILFGVRGVAAYAFSPRHQKYSSWAFASRIYFAWSTQFLGRALQYSAVLNARGGSEKDPWIKGAFQASDTD